MQNLYTIGVYGINEDDFFQNLIDNNIAIFCDIRRRRGVRGSKYAFVNSLRLQKKLKEIDIDYHHFIELSPTNDIRDKQKEEDKKNNILKRKRIALGDTFIRLYNEQHLFDENLKSFFNLYNKGKNIVLFCVEKEHTACHRSLLTENILQKYPNTKIVNL